MESKNLIQQQREAGEQFGLSEDIRIVKPAATAAGVVDVDERNIRDTCISVRHAKHGFGEQEVLAMIGAISSKGLHKEPFMIS